MDQTANSPPSRRTGLRHSSQERKFSFAVYARAETTGASEFGRHVFEIAVYRERLLTLECEWWGQSGPNCPLPTQSSIRSLSIRMDF
jgi:hypothetical protein